MVKVGIISIGDELLNGFTVDTNSSYIAKEICSYDNLDVNSIISVKDNMEDIELTLKYHIENNFNLLFITGGLGPTHDDITKKALSRFFNSSLILFEPHFLKLKKKLKTYKIKSESHIESQSMILDISKPINNDFGMALGMSIQYKKTILLIVPGVPSEMKHMLHDTIIPDLINPLYKKSLNYITLLTTGIYESKLYQILKTIIEKNKKDYKVSFLPSYTGVKVRLMDLKKDEKLFLKFKDVILEKIDKYVYGFNNDKIENIVSKLIINNNYTLSIAESCTGGLLSKKITDIDGCSNFYKGSIVAYDNSIKIDQLDIPENILKDYGAVSQEVAIEMALNVKNKFKTDIGIATTGISGPSGGSIQKPVGLIYIAVSVKNKIICKKFNLAPYRKIHRKMAVHTALNVLRNQLK